MNRAAGLMAACTMWLAPLGWGQEFPNSSSILQTEPRLAQAPAITPLPALHPHPQAQPVAAAMNPSFSELKPTESMWFYEQERLEHSNPKNAVRANAEYLADQRRRRLAAMEWFGYSNARPTSVVTPYTNRAASPQWGSNNSRDPYLWSGIGRPTIVHLPASPVWR
jgi:hypothetical protein